MVKLDPISGKRQPMRYTGPRFLRWPTHDRQQSPDEEAADAWLDTQTAKIKLVAVGHDPNNTPGG